MKNHKNQETLHWEKLKEGDINALGGLYDQYINILFSYGMQLSNNKDHVMNCIHDLFIDLYKYKSSLAKTDNVKSYLFKSLKRKIFKKDSTKLDFYKNDYLANVSIVKENYSKSIEDDLIAKELVSERALKLAEAMNSLTERQRRALFLKFNQDMSYEEIAEAMNITVETARTTIYRATKLLRNILAFLIYYTLFTFI